MNKNKTFQSSVKIWLTQNIFAIIFMIAALLLLFLIKQVLKINDNIEFNYYLKIIIMIFGYIGIIIGTHKAFNKILDNGLYLSRATKYLTGIYQIILFISVAFICYINEVNYIIFIGLYLTIFVQFLLNYYYTLYNNYKFPINKKIYESQEKSSKNTNSNILNVNTLK